MKSGRIGYACLTVGVMNTNLRSCTLKNAEDDYLAEIIAHNLSSLERIIDYNIQNNIHLFRISSDLIPFGSSPVNTLRWPEIFRTELTAIGDKIRKNDMRVSMHPGQYTVLNSNDPGIVQRAVDDLNYHALVLDCLGVGPEHKIILHIGGIYKDKDQAILRFKENYNSLKDSVKRRLVIENDDKSYNIVDALQLGEEMEIPVVYDNLHNAVNPFESDKNDNYWVQRCRKTWKEIDGPQKIHYSQQDPDKKSGSHSASIRINEFMNFYEGLETDNLDIMLEVKDKNLSAVKCINCTSLNRNIKGLEAEWSRYKYAVLEKSPQNYNQIRKLLKNKEEYPDLHFYTLIEQALAQTIIPGQAINAASHVWGYFKDIASEKERTDFITKRHDYESGKIALKSVKSLLWRMAIKYQQSYLMNSLYFYF